MLHQWLKGECTFPLRFGKLLIVTCRMDHTFYKRFPIHVISILVLFLSLPTVGSIVTGTCNYYLKVDDERMVNNSKLNYNC